jgi:hypothetical protein
MYVCMYVCMYVNNLPHPLPFDLSPLQEPPKLIEFQHLRLGVQLAKYGVNLTKLAAEGKLERVVGDF